MKDLRDLKDLTMNDVKPISDESTTLKTTQGQTDDFFGQLPSKCYLPEAASVGDLARDLPLGCLQGGYRTVSLFSDG